MIRSGTPATANIGVCLVDAKSQEGGGAELLRPAAESRHQQPPHHKDNL